MARYLFYAVFAAAFISSCAGSVWATFARARAARRMAERAGLNPQDAASTAMLTADGLDATYLVSATRPAYAAAAASGSLTGSNAGSAAAAHTVEDRLRELDRLRDGGLISDEEYKAQHKAIVSSV